jgi:uncharacterized protein YegL
MTMNDFNLDISDLVDNPSPRLPVLLCLDTSGSMIGAPIQELRRGVELFYQSVFEDEVARYSAEISVITFGGQVTTAMDFSEATENVDLALRAHGATPMGSAVLEALDALEDRKKEYQSAGVDYYQPWLVLMTDGAPTDDIEESIERVVALTNRKKLSLFPIGIGAGANLTVLNRYSPERPALRLRGLNFSDFFAWLSASVQRVSASTPGQAVPLDVEGIKGWAEV